MIYDAHAHLGTPQERQIRRGTPIISMICAQNPPEAQELEILCRQEAKNPSWLVPAYGLHPWQTGDYTVRDMEPFLSRASIIGEIGMDNVWCEVPLDRQQEAFEAQLALAHTAHKPVVLHTKGQETEIARIIRRYPNRYLVHWYSDLHGLEAYLDQDCYFTLGPDLKQNPAVHQVLALAPKERILVETDGWSAVEWALGAPAPISGLPGILTENMKEIARFHKLSLSEAEQLLAENFWRFTGMSAQ